LSAGTSLPRPAVYFLRVAALAVVYYAAARLGLRFATIGQSISLVWPPTGIALAALLIFGRGAWPGIAIGAFLANAATPVPPPIAGMIAAGNALEAILGATLLVRIAGSAPRLDSMRTVRTLILLAAPAGALVGALAGVGALVFGAMLQPESVPTAIAVWWTGDLLGVLVVAPLLLAWFLERPRMAGARGPIEVVLLCLGTVVAAELGLGSAIPLPDLVRRLDYLYLLFPFVVWAGLRFGARGASLLTFTVTIIAVFRTLEGVGPFNTATAGGTLFAVACYLAIVAITGLFLAAAVSHEREAATETLRTREEQLQVALDAARMGVWYWSATENRLTWDHTLRKIYGLGPGDRIAGYEDFIGRVHPDDREFVERTVRTALTEGGRLDYEFRIVLPDGRVRWIADMGRVVTDQNGKVVAMTGTCQDITDRRTAEEQLQLAHRMESVGRLAGGVAHEANNQMTVVLSAAEYILARKDLPPAVRSDTEQIRSAAERTAAVTAQLLAFSRQQLRKIQVLDLNALVEKFRPVLERTLGADCRVTLMLEPVLDPVRADPGQLEQVLLNLALNSRDAMPRGGSLRVETGHARLPESSGELPPGVSVRPGRYVLLAVSDTGHGMDPATLSRMFEPFFTTKGVGRGTGLGLSTVYGIVKQSDGYVWAYSQLGRGTTIRIYLPAAQATSETAVEELPREPAAHGELVLVVEDDAAVRAFAARALAEEGYRVIEAESGDRALELLRAEGHRPAIVLTDVVMPGMTGSELADAVSRLRPGTPVLFTSGYPDEEILRRGLLDPGAAFLPKPFSPEALVRAVRVRARTPGSAIG
jgi:PAS domain S-box-containing protein